MWSKSGLALLGSLAVAAQVCYGAAEATVKVDGFAKIVSQLEEGEARAFFAELATTGTEFTFPFVKDTSELAGTDLWLEVDDARVPVEEEYMLAFCRVIAEGRVTLTPREYRAPKRVAGQVENRPPQTKAPGKAGAKKHAPRKKSSSSAEPAGKPAYRLSCVYGDATLSPRDAAKAYPDLEVAGVVDKLQFKNFPYNRDGDAQKLFRECQKKIEGLMSSASGREGVLRTYAYYDRNDQSWKADLLDEILEFYDWGRITKE
jgi:hypothetical protein